MIVYSFLMHRTVSSMLLTVVEDGYGWEKQLSILRIVHRAEGETNISVRLLQTMSNIVAYRQISIFR